MMENTDASIGRILKDRRQELGYTLQAAEEATRIRKTYLDSLENNRFSELPGQACVTGFIRIYAGYLGLKSNPLLALLNDLQSVEEKCRIALTEYTRNHDLQVREKHHEPISL